MLACGRSIWIGTGDGNLVIYDIVDTSRQQRRSKDINHHMKMSSAAIAKAKVCNTEPKSTMTKDVPCINRNTPIKLDNQSRKRVSRRDRLRKLKTEHPSSDSDDSKNEAVRSPRLRVKSKHKKDETIAVHSCPGNLHSDNTLSQSFKGDVASIKTSSEKSKAAITKGRRYSDSYLNELDTVETEQREHFINSLKVAVIQKGRAISGHHDQFPEKLETWTGPIKLINLKEQMRTSNSNTTCNTESADDNDRNYCLTTITELANEPIEPEEGKTKTE